MSADPLDDASEQEQQERDRGITAARRAASSRATVVYYSHCRWCGEVSTAGRAYCSYGMDSCAWDARRAKDIRAKQGIG